MHSSLESPSKSCSAFQGMERTKLFSSPSAAPSSPCTFQRPCSLCDPQHPTFLSCKCPGSQIAFLNAIAHHVSSQAASVLQPSVPPWPCLVAPLQLPAPRPAPLGACPPGVGTFHSDHSGSFTCLTWCLGPTRSLTRETWTNATYDLKINSLCILKYLLKGNLFHFKKVSIEGWFIWNDK